MIGASGSGKSTWAAQRFRRTEIVSSDELRAVVGSGDADLDATTDAFAALDLIVAARARRRLTTVIDTLGLDPVRRRGYLEAARAAGLPAIAVLVDTDADLCRARNRSRDRPVPAPALASQLRRMTDAAGEVETEGFAAVVRVSAVAEPRTLAAEPEPAAPPAGLRFVLQVSRFPWDADPAGWLTSVATRADEVGFTGLALMDHLIQIPQVGRAWDPIPEPWVTLGLLAGLPTRLELGTLVSPASMHLPGRLAKAAATLDVLTGGRAFCGVGAGWWEREHAAYGVAVRAGRRSGSRTSSDAWRCCARCGVRARRPIAATPSSCPRRRCIRARSARCRSSSADAAHACWRWPHVSATRATSRPRTSRKARAVMGDKPVTVLDVPVLGPRSRARGAVGRAAARTYVRGGLRAAASRGTGRPSTSRDTASSPSRACRRCSSRPPTSPDRTRWSGSRRCIAAFS